MKRILSISSQVVYGPVGNTAAAPAMQALGHDVMQVPTILLSHHPGHGKPDARPTEIEFFTSLLNRAITMGQVDAVMTGFFANAEQVSATADIIRTLNKNNTNPTVLIDPVIGDHGKLYVPEEVATAIRDLLLPLATIATPNLFELQWLTGTAKTDIASAARSLNIPEVIVTSVPSRKSYQIDTLLVTNDLAYAIGIKKRASVPNGTGDFLAGTYLGYRLTQSATIALRKSVIRLRRIIEASEGSKALAMASLVPQ